MGHEIYEKKKKVKKVGVYVVFILGYEEKVKKKKKKSIWSNLVSS